MFSYKFILLGLSLASSTIAVPASYRFRREVPQEHSHEAILIDIRKQLAISNPQNLGDPVFGLLGAAAAAQGLGTTTDADCLQQATADQAFTNAKAANDVAGMTSALIYRALERNSGSVGGASPNCTSATATNPEIAALAQHQDPAGDGAQAFNKNLVLELAKQIASIGGTATDALKSGTFAPGQIGDPTAKGNTCDDANDQQGCIVSQNLLVEDATADEINAAVAGVSASSSGNSTAAASSDSSASDASASACPTAATVTVTAASGAETTAAATAATAAAAATTTAAAASSTAAAGNIGDFGSCSVPQIEFGAGFDNRKETSFEPVDKTSYNHGSAQNIDIITQFICDTLTNSCGADATAKATCASATTAADGQTAKTGAQADAFNAVFGITTNFASLAVISDTGSTIQAGAAATAAASAATSAAAAATTTAAAADTTAAAATTTAAAAAATTAAASSSAASGTNLQTFTGNLGGVTAPAVTDLGSGAQPFQVDGNSSFSSLQNALVRSCDVQHNQCANAANSSGNSGDLTVSACGDQQTQCNAQAQSTAASA